MHIILHLNIHVSHMKKNFIFFDVYQKQRNLQHLGVVLQLVYHFMGLLFNIFVRILFFIYYLHHYQLIFRQFFDLIYNKLVLFFVKKFSIKRFEFVLEWNYVCHTLFISTCFYDNLRSNSRSNKSETNFINNSDKTMADNYWYFAKEFIRLKFVYLFRCFWNILFPHFSWCC